MTFFARLLPSLVLSAALSASVAVANSSGITGFSGQFSGSTCNACHAGGGAPTVTLTGPTTLRGDQVGNYTLTITGGPARFAGLDISADNTAAKLKTATAGVVEVFGELTQSAPIAFRGASSVQINFNLEPPRTGGTVVLYGAGLSADGAGGRSGDRAAAATLTVTVTGVAGAPVVRTPASATPALVAGLTAVLSVAADDDGGAGGLSYTWSSLAGPAPVAFSANGTSASQQTTATFRQAGDYTLSCSIKDATNLSTTSQVQVKVVSTPTNLQVSPDGVGVPLSGTLQFSASARDQFNQAVSPQPSFTWALDAGGGTLSSTGLFTAGSLPGGPFPVTARGGGLVGSASVRVAAGTPPTLTQSPTAAASGLSAALRAWSTDDAGEPALTYSWALLSGPGSATFAPNASNAAQRATATFTAAGTYQLLLTVRDADGLTATGAVSLTVEEPPAPAPGTPEPGVSGEEETVDPPEGTPSSGLGDGVIGSGCSTSSGQPASGAWLLAALVLATSFRERGKRRAPAKDGDRRRAAP